MADVRALSASARATTTTTTMTTATATAMGRMTIITRENNRHLLLSPFRYLLFAYIFSTFLIALALVFPPLVAFVVAAVSFVVATCLTKRLFICCFHYWAFGIRTHLCISYHHKLNSVLCN